MRAVGVSCPPPPLRASPVSALVDSGPWGAWEPSRALFAHRSQGPPSGDMGSAVWGGSGPAPHRPPGPLPAGT